MSITYCLNCYTNWEATLKRFFGLCSLLSLGWPDAHGHHSGTYHSRLALSTGEYCLDSNQSSELESTSRSGYWPFRDSDYQVGNQISKTRPNYHQVKFGSGVGPL